MRSLYFWAIGVAGIFTFLPGRRMNEAFFTNAPIVGFIGVACVITGLLGVMVWQQRGPRI